MKIKLLKHLMFFGVMLFASVISAQTVTGTVTDANGPLPGASVIVKGTENGTETDFDGKFSIDNVASDAVLVVSYVGYVTREVSVAGKSVVNVVLVEDANQLNEVVVVGYVAQARGDISGSVASVDISEAVKVPVTNAAEALQGRVSGVTVFNNASPGAPPRVVIRGFGTSNNSNPLYIIDGVQTDDPNVFNSLNPADIKQMNVLKDGAASIYGARAANGVVIVATNSGGYNMDKARVSFDIYTGSSNPTNLPDLLNAQQHGDMIFQSLANDGAALTHPQYGSGPTAVVPTTIQGAPVSATVAPGGTNWPEAITRNAPTTNVSFSLSNGTETGKYFMSANYLSREGVLNNTFFERGTSRLNSEFKILNGKVRVGEHLNVAFSNGQTGTSEAFENSFRSSPLIPVFDDNGDFAGTFSNSLGLGNARSPFAQLERNKNDFNKSLRVFGDVYAEVDITEGLTAKTSIGISMNNFDRRGFLALDPEHGEPLSTNTLTVQDLVTYDWTWTNTINYSKKFGEHSLNLLAGVEAVKNVGSGKQISRTGFLFEDPDFYELSVGSGVPNVDNAFRFESSLFSIFGSVIYSYQDKYFATATLRRDETSRFLDSKKSGVFPSFSAGWLISNEDFFPTDGIINRLKLKASYGELGNQSLSSSNPGVNISALSEGFSNYAIGGSAIATGSFLQSVGNPNLEWETSQSTNIGLEFGLLDNKLSLEVEYFKITTDGIIDVNSTRIPDTGPDAGAPFENLGNIENTGFDLAIGYNDKTDSGFSYGINFNLSHYKNEVTDFGGNILVGNSGFRGGAVTRTEAGQPISSFFGRVVTGFDANGRFTYQDVNNDGNINDDDRTYIGSPHPDFTYGINVNLAYKGFDLAGFFTGSQGNDIYNYNKIYQDFPTFFNGNRSTRILDSWTPTNTNATLPALSQTITNAETNPNTYFVEDGSFFRLKNLQLGYTLPESFVSKAKMESVRIYLQGTNLFTITDYNGVDPEISTGGNLTIGVDNQVFPIAKIYSLGVNIKI